ncbi:Ig-like domain-containing protein [Pseudogemmatithrix spongiicola]|uniref:Ig-like domain-containing protein n=1 Tax=Pseudogemmatithrix spongiicola TaxID=3062599 RepID=A0AA49K1Z9_9BACT|nr:Ig-like domain-containing protein [Gemmatimonadaceae bacterium 'strain 138']WKW16254.1 Ig-like domain-containing protein [Gemmatimonadaceae bacterium 'strain 318']
MLPPEPVDRVEILVADTVLEIGATRQLTARALSAFSVELTDRPVTWSVSPAGPLSVDPQGLVTALAPGSAAVTASAGGKVASRVLTAREPVVASVAVTGPASTLFVDHSLNLTATPRSASNQPLAGRIVTWTSSNPSVASVSDQGVVTGVGAGTVTITAVVEAIVGQMTLTVSLAPIASITVSGPGSSVVVGQSLNLTATARSSSGQALSGRSFVWATSDAAVATVSSAGIVTGVAAGTATISASAEGVSGSMAVSVSAIPVATVTVTPALDTLEVGETLQLAARTFASGGSELTGRGVTWQSLNTAVATVSAAGLVTAVGPGSTTVRATSEGVNADATVVAVSTSGFWESRAAMPNARWAFSMGAVSGTIVAVGGFRVGGHRSDVEAYDATSNTWSIRSGSGFIQTGAGAGVIGGKLYAAGGTDCCVVSTQVRAYDPSTQLWTSLAGLTVGPRADPAAAVIGNVLYVAGGRNGSTTVATHESFDPTAATNGVWTIRASMPTARTAPAGAALDGKFYVVGGQLVGGAFANHVEVYDPATNAWTARTAMPTARADLVLLAHNGRLYAIGGNNGTPLGVVEEYNPTTNTWRTLAVMPTARIAARGAVVNGKLYVIGGYNGVNTALGTVEAFTPP